MRKLTILVDMDDTIENLLDSWLHMLNVRHGTFVTPDMITEWDIPKFFPELTEKEVYEPLFEYSLWADVKPKWDAVEYLKMLHDDGHEIYITTSSNFETICGKVFNVIDRYFPYIDRRHIIVATKKQMIRGDVMVDDGPHNLEGGEYEKILMTAPHNRTYNAEANGMLRVNSWMEAYGAISEIACNQAV